MAVIRLRGKQMLYKDKSIKQPPRFCKYIHCKKLLPKDTHHRKKYCPDTDCYAKQNKLEAIVRREANKKVKIISKVCALDGCDNQFEMSDMKRGICYCSEECRKEKRKQTSREYFKRHNQTADKPKREMVTGIEKRVDKLRDSGINPRFLVRGNISYGNIASAMSMNS